MSEAEMWNAIAGVSAVVVVVFMSMAIWAIVTRQPWWKLRKTIYFALCGLGLAFAWMAFMALTASTLREWQAMVLGFGSLILVLWLSYLASVKFEQ